VQFRSLHSLARRALAAGAVAALALTLFNAVQPSLRTHKIGPGTVRDVSLTLVPATANNGAAEREAVDSGAVGSGAVDSGAGDGGGGERGAVDSRTRTGSGSATLPLRGPEPGPGSLQAAPAGVEPGAGSVRAASAGKAGPGTRLVKAASMKAAQGVVAVAASGRGRPPRRRRGLGPVPGR
jgi:hypothetical protein